MGGASSSERRRHQQPQQQPRVVQQQRPPQPAAHRASASQYPAQQQQQYPAQQSQYPQRGPPPQRVPPGGAAAPAGGAVSEAKAVKNECTIMVDSIKYENGLLSFRTNCNIACELELHVAVRVDVMHGSVMITPNKPKAPPPRMQVQPGEVMQEVPIDLTNVSEQEQKYLPTYPKQIPIVVALYYTSPSDANETCSEYSMIQILPQGKFVKQLLRTNAGVFKIENMFGGEHADVGTVVDGDGDRGESPQPVEGVNDDEDEDGLCVICLTNEKNTLVMPCRHLCLCKDCAEELRQKGPKCPVCRGPLAQLVQVK